jgi:hypothetical protein
LTPYELPELTSCQQLDELVEQLPVAPRAMPPGAVLDAVALSCWLKKAVSALKSYPEPSGADLSTCGANQASYGAFSEPAGIAL